jgi:hypothetical protein
MTPDAAPAIKTSLAGPSKAMDNSDGSIPKSLPSRFLSNYHMSAIKNALLSVQGLMPAGQTVFSYSPLG